MVFRDQSKWDVTLEWIFRSAPTSPTSTVSLEYLPPWTVPSPFENRIIFRLGGKIKSLHINDLYNRTMTHFTKISLLKSCKFSRS